MEAEEMANFITESLYMCDEDEEEGEGIIETINTYKEKGLLTNDVGIMIKLKDQESAFYVTVRKQ